MKNYHYKSGANRMMPPIFYQLMNAITTFLFFSLCFLIFPISAKATIYSSNPADFDQIKGDTWSFTFSAYGHIYTWEVNIENEVIINNNIASIPCSVHSFGGMLYYMYEYIDLNNLKPPYFAIFINVPAIDFSEYYFFKINVDNNSGYGVAMNMTGDHLSPEFQMTATCLYDAQSNHPPTADAGPDQTIKEGNYVSLDGSSSYDTDDGIASYQWTQISGPSVYLSDSTAIQPGFNAPDVGSNGDNLVFELTVADFGGLTDTDRCTIHITPIIQPPPVAPSNLNGKAKSSTQIMLGWTDNSSDETGFKIERKIGNCSSANAWTQIAVKPANSTSHTIAGLTPNTLYSFRVRAYNAGGNSAYSNCSVIKTGLSGTPPSPSNLRTTSASSSIINLAWVDNSTNETGFRIFRKAGAGAWLLLGTVGPNIKTFSDTTATNNNASMTYQYYVCAYNALGNSPVTSTAIIPYQPINLNAVQGGVAGSINLMWTDKCTNETGFEIFRKAGSCSSADAWTRIGSVGTDSISKMDGACLPGNIYSYKVRSFKQSGTVLPAYGYSLWSNCNDETAP
jgi:hypothetical protein